MEEGDEMINQAISGMYKAGTGKPKRKMFSFRSPAEQSEELAIKTEKALTRVNRGKCLKVTMTKGDRVLVFDNLNSAAKSIGLEKNYLGRCERARNRCRGWKVDCIFENKSRPNQKVEVDEYESADPFSYNRRGVCVKGVLTKFDKRMECDDLSLAGKHFKMRRSGIAKYGRAGKKVQGWVITCEFKKVRNRD